MASSRTTKRLTNREGKQLETLNIRMFKRVKKRLNRLAENSGESRTAVIERLINEEFEKAN